MNVSVCIPTYNQAHYLEQAIKSAVNQTLVPFEIIVSNDCSTDTTKKVLEKLSQIIPNLKVINQPKNLGIAKNTDACLRMANGDCIVRLDSDDYLDQEYVENLSSLLIKYPKAGYAHAAVQEIDQNGRFLQQRKLYRKSVFFSSEQALKASVKGYRVAANIIMFKREALLKVNYLENRPDYVEDYHVTSAIASNGYGNVYSDEIMSFYRVWVDAAKVRQRRKLMEIVGLRRVFEEVIEPAYQRLNWNLNEIRISRSSFACRQANCLSWNVYTQEEKQQLAIELLKLSSDSKARFYIKMYSSSFGKAFGFFFNGVHDVRRKVKGLVVHYIKRGV